MAIHEIRRSARIEVTAELIRALRPRAVLEIGSAEFSFRAEAGDACANWITADTQGDCDIRIDINVENVRFPLAAESVDVVVCTEVLEHLLWPQCLLGEVHRVLCPTGAAIVSVPNMNSLTYRIAWLLGRLPSCAASANLPIELDSTAYSIGGRLVGGHVIDFNSERLHKLLRYCGLPVERLVSCGLYWHRQIAPPWITPPTLSSNLIAIARKAAL